MVSNPRTSYFLNRSQNKTSLYFQTDLWLGIPHPTSLSSSSIRVRSSNHNNQSENERYGLEPTSIHGRITIHYLKKKAADLERLKANFENINMLNSREIRHITFSLSP